MDIYFSNLNIDKFNFKILIKFFICLVLLIFFVFAVLLYPLEIISSKSLSIEEYNKLLYNDSFIYSVSSNVFANDINEDLNDVIIEYKLFDLITIKKLKVNVSKNEKCFYSGGNCIGFDLKSKGAIIAGGNFVYTIDGYINPMKDSGLEIGDIITKIDNVDVDGIDSIINYLKSVKEKKSIEIQVNRNGNIYLFNITPVLDIQSNTYKLGLWLKDSIIGVGTLTYIEKDSNTFGALGHPINTENTVDGFELESGSIYNCSVVGVKEAQNNQAGQLLGTFSLSQEKQGEIITNNKFGIFGNLSLVNTLINNKNEIQIAMKNEIVPGKAKILSTINGNEVREFDIEIIKTNYQSGNDDKNMIIRVIDKELLNKTGGIVQGMSGSPIIQNGKLIGAITHVFLNDASKGFGLYIENMINNA